MGNEDRNGGQRGRLVYSTEAGALCPECEHPRDACICREERESGRGSGDVLVARETKGRKGKGVTVVRGLILPSTQLEALAKELKRRCGSGGTVKEGVIEIQGDHRDAIVTLLVERGFRAKRAGG